MHVQPITHPSSRGGGTTFEEEVLPLTADLHRQAYIYTRRRPDAEDLVQETLLNAYRAYDRLGEEPRHIRAWLAQIMRNAWISRYRAARCRPVEKLMTDISEDHVAAPSTPPSPLTHSAEDVVLRTLPNPALTEAFTTLTEPSRLTMYYVVVVGMTSREVADLLGIPVGTVLSRMHRGRNQLRQALKDRSSDDAEWQVDDLAATAC